MRALMHSLTAVALFALAVAAPAALREGVEFEFVTNAAPAPLAGDQVRVTEYFNYSCPACNFWYPSVEDWLEVKPEFVTWERTPLVFSRYQGLFARTQFVLEAFAREDLADEVFSAIHTEKKLLNSQERIAEWFAEEHGLDEEAVIDAFSSFGVATKIKRASRRAKGFGIVSTPSFVVADRYLLSPSHHGDPAQLFKVMDELVAAVHAGNAPR